MGKKKPSFGTILVVDDEEFDRTTASQELRAEGYTILEAESYSDAMATFQDHRDAVGLLVADVSLPDGNGCALAIAMQKEKPDLRVLFVSFYVGSEICRSYGLDVSDLHFLKKPFAGSELRKRVQAVINSSQGFPRIIVPKTRTSAGDSV